jgi:hypothetical protein
MGPRRRRDLVSDLNPLAFVFIAFCGVIGALVGSVLIGLAVGLGFVIVASLTD